MNRAGRRRMSGRGTCRRWASERRRRRASRDGWDRRHRPRRAGVAGPRWWRAARSRWGAGGSGDIRLRLVDGSLSFVFQPIVDLHDWSTVGFEGLTRFDRSSRDIAALFDDAATQGSLIDLELHAVAGILERSAALPDGAYVAVNASPSTLASSAFVRAVGRFPLGRLVVEVNEREVVGDYERLRSAIAPLRASGLRLAVDDAGAGVASLHHLIELRPDIIKLDGALTQAIERHRGQRAMTRALAAFAAETGAVVVAECVESLGSARALAALGIEHGQGYALGRPGPAPAPG